MPADKPRGYYPDYRRLAAYLKQRQQQRITLTFAQLEQAILLGPLPYAARRTNQWWSNTQTGRGPQNRGWLDAGWRVAAVDQIAGTVTFERFDQENS